MGTLDDVNSVNSHIMKIYHLLLITLLLPWAIWPQEQTGFDIIAPFSEGLAAVKKGGQWGFIDTKGTLVIDFRDDLVWNKDADPNGYGVENVRYPQFKNGRCLVQKLLDEEQVPVYGFIDTQGQVVIPPEYLNVTNFDGDYAIGILLTKTFRGQNKFQLRIYDYKFGEVILNKSGEIMRLIEQRSNIQMNRKRYVLPKLNTRILAPGLLAVRNAANTWDLLKIDL